MGLGNEISYTKLRSTATKGHSVNKLVFGFISVAVLSLIFFYTFYTDDNLYYEHFDIQNELVSSETTSKKFIPIISNLENSVSKAPQNVSRKSSSSTSSSLPTSKKDKPIIYLKQTTSTSQSNSNAYSMHYSSTMNPHESSKLFTPSIGAAFNVSINPTAFTFTTPFEHTQEQGEKFLVNGPHCQIPNVNPYDPSILHLVEVNPTISCNQSYPQFTYTKGKILFINRDINGQSHEDLGVKCCYRGLYRDSEGRTDNKYRLDGDCKEFQSGARILDEFIRVECANDTNFKYVNYHCFIQVKKLLPKRKKDNFNILMIGSDAVSRLNMHRQFNRTYRFLKNNMDAIEMVGYNKVGDNTFPNLIPILTGYMESELGDVCWRSNDEPLDACPFIWKKFKENGYLTLYAEDTPWMSTFNYVKKGFYKTPTDYYLRPFIKAAVDEIGHRKVMNCHQCVGPISQTEMILGWLSDFVKTLRNQNYFAFSWINSLTHDSLNTGSKADEFYEAFFKNSFNQGLLERTIVIWLSDHGLRWGKIRETYVGKLEERLPMLMISFPKSFKKRYPGLVQNVKNNVHRLTTPLDLHSTLKDLLYHNKKRNSIVDNVPEHLYHNYTTRAISFFDKIPNNRSCDDAAIAEHWCTCQSTFPVALNDSGVEFASKFVVETINELLEPHRNKCAILELVEIKSAREADSKFVADDADKEYSVLIKTRPDDALFEATVQLKNSLPPVLLGPVSRLTLYRHHSECVDDPILRKYCSCIDQRGLK